MFAERFDALMCVAEVSNALLGRAVSMNSSHIGRLRSGARPLPKKHDYIRPMCSYLAGRITKDYQLDALQKLTGVGSGALASREGMAAFLEQWLLRRDADASAAAGRLISGFSRVAAGPSPSPVNGCDEDAPHRYAAYLYGNAGKRRAVEQFFLMILREEKPRTLLLFSDENMAWLYEDAAFAARWTELFTRVAARGNRVRVIHTVSRDMNELMEAVAKWAPIYMTGAIEPYYYQRLRDGLFNRTMFIAPGTAAVISSSVRQDTDGMLNLFITDRAAVDALADEFGRYLALCRPLMRVFTARDTEGFRQAVADVCAADGDACFSCTVPPLFALPEALAHEIAERTGSAALLPLWKKSVSLFRKSIAKNRLFVIVPEPGSVLPEPRGLTLPMPEFTGTSGFVYTREQYLSHYERLMRLACKYENLSVFAGSGSAPDMLLYVKEDAGAVMAGTNAPMSAFVMHERSMVNALWDHAKRNAEPL